MKTHPLRRYFLKNPKGLQAARRELALEIGVHPGTLRNVDSGYRPPKPSTAMKIENAVGIKASQLLYWPYGKRAA